MKRTLTIILALVLVPVSLLAARGSGWESRGTFQGQLKGAIDAKITGNAVYLKDMDGAFSLVLANEEQEGITLVIGKPGMLPVGKYPVVDLMNTRSAESQVTAEGFAGSFTYKQKTYAFRSGLVDVRKSEVNQVVGLVVLQGVEFDPFTRQMGNQPLAISGAFHAVSGR